MKSVVAFLLIAGACQAQCYRSYPSYSYYKAQPASYSYPYYNNSLTVYHTVNFPPPAAAGATAYAYQAQQYPFLDATLVLNSSARLVETAQALASNGLREHTAAFTQILGAQAQVAEAQGQAAALAELAKIARETKPGQSAIIARSASGQITVQRSEGGIPGGDRIARIQAAFNESCVRCHQPGGEKPTPDLRDIGALDPKWEPIILRKVFTDDPKDVMPPPNATPKLPPAVLVDLVKSSSLLKGNGNGGEVPPQKVPAPPGKAEPLKE